MKSITSRSRAGSVKDAYRDFVDTPEGARLYNKFKEILYARSDSLAQTLSNVCLQELGVYGRDILDVIDIGGGDGDRIGRVLGFLHDKFKVGFDLDFVEQSGPFVEAFRSREIGTHCRATIHHDLFEDLDLTGSYDLVFLIHSIFAFENGDAIERVLRLPNPGGRVVVVSNAPSSFLGSLKSLVDERYVDCRYEIDQLRLDLDKRDVRYSSIEFATRWAIEADRLVEDLDVILEWITLGRYRDFDGEMQDKVDTYLNSRMIVAGGRAFFEEMETVLVIQPRGTSDRRSR